ncbi:outer membrane protein [Sphingomonas glaciei]|uniref:Outer membrane beta-barrel protein n=1 Tax=Sphingomonas glaciei TaxID=2938948 RepID=A0ABY5MRN8_9SPHN|nr:outer membrane beta-barrel protein [Sphingomonas glaciei]UUR07145.1 outer membrane beta-barrel protein [Sphingomonas glaciei]
MRKFLLASAVLIGIAAPAQAQNSGGYFGVEGGIMSAKTNRADVFADFTTVQTPATPAGPAFVADVLLPGAIRADYKRGYDFDAIAGYDFGFIRTELELGYKRAKLNSYRIGDTELATLSTALNRPSAAPDPFAPGLGALTTSETSGRMTIYSAMANALLDLGNERFSVYGGGGFGRARAKLLGNRDDAWAHQLIAGARFAVSENIDFGLKYRYFRTNRLNLGDAETTVIQGNPDLLNLGTTASPVFVERRTSAALDTQFNERFRSHSLLASLIFNFGGRDVAPPPPPPPPPPAPVEVAPPPQTQTCPDGSVVLATDVCAVPPPPPPPPPVEPVRG